MEEHEEILGGDFAEHMLKKEDCQGGCCVSSNETHKDTNGTNLRQRNVTNNIFDEIGAKREKEFKRDQGFDNRGYEGKFTVRGNERHNDQAV